MDETYDGNASEGGFDCSVQIHWPRGLPEGFAREHENVRGAEFGIESDVAESFFFGSDTESDGSAGVSHRGDNLVAHRRGSRKVELLNAHSVDSAR